MAQELKERLLAAAGPHIRRIIVFGSRARGDAEPDSDLDVAVLVDGRTAYQVMWDRDFAPVISLRVFAEADFEAALEGGFSFYRSVVREGVIL